MPSRSASQAKLMRAAANSPSFAKKVGISQSVAREFTREDSARKGRVRKNRYKRKD